MRAWKVTADTSWEADRVFGIRIPKCVGAIVCANRRYKDSARRGVSSVVWLWRVWLRDGLVEHGCAPDERPGPRRPDREPG